MYWAQSGDAIIWNLNGSINLQDIHKILFCKLKRIGFIKKILVAEKIVSQKRIILYIVFFTNT